MPSAQALDLASAAAPAAAAQPRDPRIDAAKAVAIVLVVLGHAKGVPAWFATAVYSFHVPAFFLLSGWFAERRAGQPLRALLPSTARSLLLPYAAFFAAAYGYWLVTRGIGEKAQRWGDTPWWDPLFGFVTAIGPQLYVNPALWFLPALFVTMPAYVLLRRALGPMPAALAAVACALAWMSWFPPLGLRLPFALDVLPVALMFYAVGAAVAGRWRWPRTRRTWSAAVAVLLLSWALLAAANGRADLVQLRFGASTGGFAAAALLGSALLLLVSAPLASLRAVQWLGRNTLLILCAHMPIFFVLSGVAAVAGLFAGSKPGAGWALTVTALALAACVPLRALLLRYAPWTLGLRPARGAAP